MSEPAGLAVTFGSEARKAPRRRARVELPEEELLHRPLILDSPTLLDGLSTIVLWAEFTGRAPADERKTQ